MSTTATTNATATGGRDGDDARRCVRVRARAMDVVGVDDDDDDDDDERFDVDDATWS